MATKLIKLGDGIIVEVEAAPGEIQQIVGSVAQRIEDATLEKIRPVLLRACIPVLEAWQDLRDKAQGSGLAID